MEQQIAVFDDLKDTGNRTTRLSKPFAVRLDPDVIELLKAAAERLEVPTTALVRRWIGERLQLELEAGVLTEPVSSLGEKWEARAREGVLSSGIPYYADLAKQVFDEVRAEAESHREARVEAEQDLLRESDLEIAAG